MIIKAPQIYEIGLVIMMSKKPIISLTMRDNVKVVLVVMVSTREKTKMVVVVSKQFLFCVVGIRNIKNGKGSEAIVEIALLESTVTKMPQMYELGLVLIMVIRKSRISLMIKNNV